MMKRCNTCGHTNGRLRQATNYYTGQPIPGQFVCMSVRSCIRRIEQGGQWIGKRVLRRIDRDGTEWVIRRHDDAGLRGLDGMQPCNSGWVLIATYRGHRMSSQHASLDAAKAHADEMLASLVNPKAADYRVPEPESADQMELM